MSNSWFRVYAEFADDPKVQMMPEVLQRRLIMLFCDRCRGPVREEELAFHWRISDAELQETKQEFLRRGFIDEGWSVLNWNKRQFISDSSTERVHKYRSRVDSALKRSETFQKQDDAVTVTPPEQNRTDTEHKKQKTSPQAAFVLPDWIPRESWDGWIEMRKKKRAAPTVHAMELAVRRLETLKASGSDPGEVLDTSTFRGWSGLFEVNQSPLATGYGNNGGSHGNEGKYAKLFRELAMD